MLNALDVIGVCALLLTLPFAVVSQFLEVDFEVEEQCVRSCRLKNHTEVRHYDDSFGSHEQCEGGCKLWKTALNSSCQAVCDGIQDPLSAKELYCIIGCNDAVNRYYTEVRNRLGTPPPPALVADSLTATSLRLEWNFPEAKKAGLRYFLQWRYEEHAGAWQYCRNQSWGPQDTVFVDNLQPYTKYRFRVALILSNLTDPIVSPPSVVISTRPAGVPASPPIIVRAVPVDSTRISVSWEPGPFPHGPLLSYVLSITDNQPNGYSALKDLPAENKFYNYKNLTPNRNYTVSIRMRNGVGHGPPAHVFITTPMEPTEKKSEKPVLILGAHHIVIEQGTEMLDDPVILYNTHEFITGLAIHVSKRLLFVSDSARNVLRMPLHKFTSNSSSKVILSPPHISFIPLDLSMDWLNEHLYILGEVMHQRNAKVWQIARCNLDGRGLTVAIAGLISKPHHIEVDPYNGYLFWVTKTGLYRLDLADISNGIKHEVQPELILNENNLGAFTVDHTNFRLLVSNQNRNTVNSVSFDGKEVSNMRKKIIASKLQKVVSMAYANGKFYWTNGNEVLYEEDHPASDSSYFHNSYPIQLSKSYIKVLVNLTSSQPVPVPVNPPTSVQAIFGTNVAKTTWQTPHLLGGQGRGAWQNWSYEISIKDLKIHNTSLIRDINSTSYTITNLNEDTEYIIKTAAYTSFGKGPWSTEFIGRTLNVNTNGKQPVILWSSMDSLLKSDASGENVETLETASDYFFTNVAWYQDELFLVTNTLQVRWYNMSSHKQGIVNEIDSARSIAIDWIGKKLYWSNPKQHLIIRGNLNGTQQEHLPIRDSMAKEITIDSINGYLYWSTGHSVECAHLNGADRITYHPAEYFSGKQVVGITLDMDHHFLYWIVQGLNSSNLYRAPMAGYASFTGGKPVVERIARLRPNIKGPMCYFNNRLIWLKNNETAVISDLRGQYTAHIRGNSLLGLNMMFVIDSSQNRIPGPTKHSSINGISVIPSIIDKNSVEVVGTWDSFNITWNPVENVNYGTVFYEIKVDNYSRNESKVITTFPSVRYIWKLMPYTKLLVTIRAFTYWGSSPHVRVIIYSPPSTPSSPQLPRAYVTYCHDNIEKKRIDVTFRWNPPHIFNGILEIYKVFWWNKNGEKSARKSHVLQANVQEFIATNLLDNTTYYFQVQAYTEVGGGDLSTTIEVNTAEESPIPTIMIASSDSIHIEDIDSNSSSSLIHGVSLPVGIGYLYKEQKVFWVNDMQELFVFNSPSTIKNKIYVMNENAASLTVDWLQRSLYYVHEETGGSSVYRVDLNRMDRGEWKSEFVFQISSPVQKIEISPYSKMIYWIEYNNENKRNELMRGKSDGTSPASVFWENLRTKRNLDTESICNCSVHNGIESAFAVDHSMTHKPFITCIDSVTHDVFSTDKYGCNCTILIDGSIIESSLPIVSLKSDLDHVYWMNKTHTVIHYLKTNKTIATGRTNMSDMVIYGTHMQPYPPKKCMVPEQNTNITVTLIKRMSESLRLKMPKVSIDEECGDISLATVEYKVYYMPYNDENDLQCDESCTQIRTFDTEIEIKELRPHSKYTFCVALTNHYTEANETIGQGIVFQTSAGAPSPPRSIEATVLSPTLVRVTWLPPRELNGDYVYYEIHWQTEAFISGIRQKGEQTVMENNMLDKQKTKLSTLLNKLTPNETYSIWVRAYSQTNETWNNSRIIKVKTFPEPENVTLLLSKAFNLMVQWNISTYVEKYVMQYALLTSHEWQDLNYTDLIDNVVMYSIDDLKPKTQYKFRLYLKYPKYEKIYVWPKDARFTFETSGDKPSPPGIPIFQTIGNDEYQVWWEASKDNGAPIEMYMLEALKAPTLRSKRSTNSTVGDHSLLSPDEPEHDWESIYNGTNTYWKIKGLTETYRYAFRVSSLNSYGWSDYSEKSQPFDLTPSAQLTDTQDLKYLIIIISITIFIILAFLFTKCCKMCCMKNKKNQLVVVPPRGPDVELATLRELPRRVNFVHNTNVLYISTQPSLDEITLLPHIRRDQITLMKFLGSGAFGEVFEGKAKGLNNNGSETKVAVKTLRKGASEQEKTEFLQEAQLMSHFKHEHILQLLGVCLDNDPHFIIMELMQGGDLLTYLRSSRKSGMNTPPLNLIDLLKMCVDVAKGCRYLEEMHFVHRDLACRNCLVSSTNPENRIVKIGDFGLARDIYKNDYYRKEGEGLLPVRWMAPESLVDGVFTCQSDVWAFGVLLWEIMTLGQQPYPARNNLEVLHYVKRGGRLGKPTDCPETLHQLMLNCWSYEPESRPTFKYCLDALERLHLQTVSSPMTGAHMGQYISTVPQRTSWKSSSEEESSRERTPFLQTNGQSEIPKYLELLYDSDCPVENDGYEVPRTTLPGIEPSVEEKNENISENHNSFSKVVNDLTSIENLLKDNSVGYTNMSVEQNGVVKKELVNS